MQDTWSWPAVMVFTLAGIGSGLYLSSSLLTILRGGLTSFLDMPVSYGLFACVIVIFGFLFVIMEAGRPLRGGLVVFNVQHSWLSREILALVAFVLPAFIDHFLPSWPLRVLSLAGAFMLILCQGFIVYNSRGVTAWNMPAIPILFIFSGFSSGCGVLLVAIRSFFQWEILIITTLISVGLNLIVWAFYLYWKRDTAFRISTRKLRHPVTLFINMGIGQLLPFLLLLFIFWFREGMEFKETIMIISGIALILASLIQKSSIILIGGYTRGIVLNV
jgi:formate-dependent nitrite reductase membrane component NrfD